MLYICEECDREIDSSKGEIIEGKCGFCMGEIRESVQCNLCGSTVKEKGNRYCEDCHRDFLGKVVKPTELYILNRMVSSPKKDTPSVEEAIKAEIMLSEPENGCIICNNYSDSPLCYECSVRLRLIQVVAMGKMHCTEEEYEELAEEYYDNQGN